VPCLAVSGQSRLSAVTPTGKIYRPRNFEASPFFKVIRNYFDEFERVYPQRFQEQYGYWRPVIRSSIDKFLKCGDLREGFARVRCPDCKEEFFVTFSCRQRSCCPSCDQKRALLLGIRLKKEVLANVPHRQWVFTIPKRLRIYFRYDRKLLGMLCRAAYESVLEVLQDEIGDAEVVPAMVTAIQTFGDLIHWHAHVHAIIAEGVFLPSGYFVRMADVNLPRIIDRWKDKVFELLIRAEKIGEDVLENMRKWEHSGFSIDNSVRLEADDTEGMQRLVEYIARCPFSLARMIRVKDDGTVIYRAGKPKCLPFPALGNEQLKAGTPRNFEVFDPLEFLAEVTQHIPNRGEHQIRYYGWYSNKKRGMREKITELVTIPGTPELDSAFRKKCRMSWAALIKCVYEVDPLKCPKCGGTMKIVSFIEEDAVIRQILRHCGLWKEPAPRAPPVNKPPPVLSEPTLDYGYFESVIC
jgi:hypothetical protein